MNFPVYLDQSILSFLFSQLKTKIKIHNLGAVTSMSFDEFTLFFYELDETDIGFNQKNRIHFLYKKEWYNLDTFLRYIKIYSFS